MLNKKGVLSKSIRTKNKNVMARAVKFATKDPIACELSTMAKLSLEDNFRLHSQRPDLHSFAWV